MELRRFYKVGQVPGLHFVFDLQTFSYLKKGTKFIPMIKRLPTLYHSPPL